MTGRALPDFLLESELLDDGNVRIAGVDEAGRGPLAGPVVAAAVVLNPHAIPDGLDDSKALSEARRLALYDTICKRCEVAVCSAPAKRIDAINIRAATLWAMAQAISALSVRPCAVLVDGRDSPQGIDPAIAVRTVVGGDRQSQSIAAASIVAKVTRDRLMARCDAAYPGYGFSRHKGYGTPAHLKALRQYGPSAVHRWSFAPVAAAANMATG